VFQGAEAGGGRLGVDGGPLREVASNPRHVETGVGADGEIVGVSVPDCGPVAEGLDDGADTVIDIAVRRTHPLGGDASYFLHDLFGPENLGNNLIGRLGGERGVGPGVHADMMASLVGAEEGLGELHDAGADNEERGLIGDGVEKVQHLVSRRVGRAVVERQPPVAFVRAEKEVIRTGASGAAPGAVRVRGTLCAVIHLLARGDVGNL